MKMTLSKKITLGVSGMLICVMIVSTLVVSVVINVQNRKASTELLAKSFDIVRDILSDRQKKLMADSRQVSTIDNMGGKVGYIAESKIDMGISRLLKATSAKVTINTYNVGLAADISKAMVYDLHGDLISFVFFEGNQATGGFTQLENEKLSASTCTVDSGQEMTETMFKKGELSKTLSKKYEGALPAQETLRFKTINNMICMVSDIPIMYEVYSKKTEKMETAQAGLVQLVQRIDTAFVDKVSKLGGTKINIFSDKGLSVGNLHEYNNFNIGSFQVADKDNIYKQHIIFNDLDLPDGNFYQGVLPIYDQGSYIGAISSMYSKSIAEENFLQVVKLLVLIALACLLVFLPLAYFLSKSIAKPILMIVAGLKDMAEGEGDLTKRLEVKTHDEVGELAKWFNAFLEKLQSIIKEISVNSETLNGASTDLSGLSHQMSEGTDSMSDKSNSVAATAEEMSANINSVAAAMEQAATNINMVATATEEMTSTVNEIAQSSAQGRAIAAEAVSQAEGASSKVNELGRAAEDIGKVTETINDISEQTNLLALNATIEAARAGEAGKGFAVVANEIKELARQTADATKEIKVNIEGIQGTTAGTVTEIEQISTIINNVNEIVSNIANAVEEQSVTTNEIAGNVSQASVGIQEVNENVSQSSSVSTDIAREISSVNKEAGEMSASSSQVSIKADDLSRLAGQLKEMVGKFKV